MSWLKTSIMAAQGVAKGEAGAHHRLTEERQGAYHYVYGAFAEPVLTIAPGDVVEVETHDAFEGKIKTVDAKPSEKLNIP